MDQQEIERRALERAQEVAGPLLDEIEERLGLDLADGSLAQLMLGDFAARLFSAGGSFVGAELVARLIEQGTDIRITSQPPDYWWPLGDFPNHQP